MSKEAKTKKREKWHFLGVVVLFAYFIYSFIHLFIVSHYLD